MKAPAKSSFIKTAGSRSHSKGYCSLRPEFRPRDRCLVLDPASAPGGLMNLPDLHTCPGSFLKKTSAAGTRGEDLNQFFNFSSISSSY